MVWLQSYFTLRSQQVVVDGCCSSSKSSVLSGLHQGSILGPLLILYVNDIFQLPFSSTSSIIHYADDILLSCPLKSSFEFSVAQSNVNILSSWVKSKYLMINHSKTKYMIISRKSPTFYYSSLSFPWWITSWISLSYKYLGVTLTFNLFWSTHINETCSIRSRNCSATSIINFTITLLLFLWNCTYH